MNADGSFLNTVIFRVRSILDEPDQDAKWTDANMVRHLINPAVCEVMTQVNLDSSNPVVMRLDITVVEDQEHYVLPPSVGSVVRITTMDDNDVVTGDIRPRHELNRHGPGWTLEGNVLRLFPIPTNVPSNTVIQVWYVPAASFRMHLAAGTAASTAANGKVSNAALTTMTLATTPTLGDREARASGLVGATLRVLRNHSSSKLYIEERTISAHTVSADGMTDSITLRRPLTSYVENDYVAYEIVPFPLHDGLVEAVALRVAVKLAVYKKGSGSLVERLMFLYKGAIKAFRDYTCNVQGRARNIQATGSTLDSLMPWRT